jgi:hypothetical protein
MSERQYVRTMYIPCIYMYVHLQICTYVYVHVYEFTISWHTCLNHVCQLLYYSMVQQLSADRHGSDMYVHVYARWSGFQMESEAVYHFNV